MASILAQRATQSTAKKDGIIVTDPEAIRLGTEWREAKVAFDGAESAKKMAEANLKPVLFDCWLKANFGRPNPESSVKLLTPSGKVTCSFQARFFPAAKLSEMGVPAQYIRPKASIKIDMDQVPEALQEKLATAVLGAVDALGCSAAAEVKFSEYPTASFESGRHTLTTEQNLAFERAGLGTVVALRA